MSVWRGLTTRTPLLHVVGLCSRTVSGKNIEWLRKKGLKRLYFVCPSMNREQKKNEGFPTKKEAFLVTFSDEFLNTLQMLEEEMNS